MNSRTETLQAHGNYMHRYVVFVFAVVITLIYFSLVAQWVSLNMVDQELVDYTHYAVRLAARGDTSAKYARQLVLARAQKLSLPLRESGVRFVGGGTDVRAFVQYEKDLTFPFTDRPVYRVKFEHELEYTPPRW